VSFVQVNTKKIEFIWIVANRGRVNRRLLLLEWQPHFRVGLHSVEDKLQVCSIGQLALHSPIKQHRCIVGTDKKSVVTLEDTRFYFWLFQQFSNGLCLQVSQQRFKML